MAQRICVLRDGKLVKTCSPSDTPVNMVVESMVGQSIQNFYPKQKHAKRRSCFQGGRVERRTKFFDIDFQVCEGEVLGIAGLMGAGQVPLARCLYGLDKYVSGKVLLEGREMRKAVPADPLLPVWVWLRKAGRRKGLSCQCQSGRISVFPPGRRCHPDMGFSAGKKKCNCLKKRG